MLPPICSICAKKIPAKEEESGLLSFALSPEDVIYNQRFEEEGFTGHPKGLHWLCQTHYKALKDYTQLPFAEAKQQADI